MKNYAAMIEKNRKKNLGKAEYAKKMIHMMAGRREQVTIRALADRTGLSVSFFYKNPEIRELIRVTRLQQGSIVYEKKADVLIYRALEQQVRMLKAEIAELEEENIQLKKKLQQAEFGIYASTIENR